ncbi:shikimate kinase [Paraburkholderia sp. J10-1]|uniref:shikimate kinase n=1 Tax=Paraburkholderia sp. J10-1 TaxID=2805430 RepID=UPI002AB77EEE|nr:shikimate kinase [Paraburkholderia sp. J10-1]
MNARRVVVTDVGELAEALRPVAGGLITFDGCDGAGKTTLALKLSEALGHEVVDVDKHLNRQMGEYVKAIRLSELASDVESAFARSPVVLLSGICMRQVLVAINRIATVAVYVQRNTPMGLAGDSDFIDVESGLEASKDVLSFFTELDREVYAYHRAYRPRENADIVFTRIAH